ncbi:MAG TPA: GAF domain-containing protein [Candidatus Tectomicrobia bacterium]
MVVLVILGLAIGLQVITAIVVRRLIQVTGRHWIWVSLAAVVVLLTGWRCIILLRGIFAGVSAQPDLATEGLVLLISICMVSGLAGIASLVLSIQRAQEAARQTAEVVLHAQQEAYETIFHAVPSEIRFKDTDNRLVRVNRTAADAEGYAVADLEGKSLWQHYPAEIAAQEYASDLEVIKTGQPKRGVLTLQPTASGVLRWVQADKLPYRDRDGKITGIIECALDITERKQAEEALSMRIEQMRSVHTIAEEITRELDFATLLQLIVQRAADLLGATRSVLYLWDEGTQTLCPQAWCNAGEWLRELRLKLGEGIAGTVAQQRQGLLVNDAQDSPYADPVFVEQYGPASTMAEPLLYRDRLIGVLVVSHVEPGRFFLMPDREPLAVLAAQATIAIENARLFQESIQRQAWLTNILEVNKRIATNEDMASLLAQIADEAAQLLRADGSVLRILQDDRLVAVGSAPLGPSVADALEVRLGEGVIGRTVLENRVFMVTDVQAHPDMTPCQKQRAAEVGINSLLSVPVPGRHHVMGVLSISSKNRRAFTDAETMILSAYAEQAAIAIEHARLLGTEESRTIMSERTNALLRTEIVERQRIEEEREQLITELESRTAEMERFTYTVSHDLKSPLITIQGFLGLLEKDAMDGDTERMEADITYIRAAAATMQRLLNELLELSRIGRVNNPLTEIALSELAQEAVTLVSGQITARGVQVYIPPDLPVIIGDRPRLLEVLQNLLDNAVKFMGSQPQPYINFGVRQEGEETVYYVQDNGIGIALRHHEKVFGLFERLDIASDGTGIGLTLVKRIIEVHGGRVWVESAGEGQGSTFCFTLPCQDTTLISDVERARSDPGGA